MNELVFKLFKLGIIGFLGADLIFFVYAYIQENLRMNKYAANAISFSCAATSNLILNEAWTFHYA